MKYLIRLENIITILIAGFLLHSCSNDKHYDLYGDSGAVYVSERTGNSIALATGYILNTPKGSKGDVHIKFPARSTMPVKENLKVSFKINNELIELYNQANKTDFKALDAQYISLSNMVVNILKGDLESKDSVSIVMAKENFKNIEAGDYLIPVEIDEVEGYLSATKVEKKRVYYYAFNTTENPHNVRPSGSEGNEGALVENRSNWSISYNGDASAGKPLEALLDGDLKTYSGGSWRAGNFWLIDLGDVKSNISGAYIRYWDARYEWKSIQVSTSIDGENWEDQGFTTPRTTVYDDYSDEGIAKFIFPVDARYVKLEPNGGLRNGSRWFILEMNIYK